MTESQKVVGASSTLLWAAENFLHNTNTNLFEVNSFVRTQFQGKVPRKFSIAELKIMLRHWMYAYGRRAGLKHAKTIVKPNFSKNIVFNASS